MERSKSDMITDKYIIKIINYSLTMNFYFHVQKIISHSKSLNFLLTSSNVPSNSFWVSRVLKIHLFRQVISVSSNLGSLKLFMHSEKHACTVLVTNLYISLNYNICISAS